MSLNITEQVKCPKCGELHEITVWQSINAVDSDLRDDLLKGKINLFRCMSCGHTALMPNPLLYTDDEHRLLISFAPCSNDSEKYSRFESVKSASKDSGELVDYEEYNLRFVSQFNELLEKILIFSSGLHDKPIELLKLLVLMQDSEKMEDRICIFGKKDGDNIEFMVQDKKEDRLYTSQVPMSTYETVSAQLRQSGVKYKSFDWEIIDLEYAKNLLRGINNTL